MKQYLVVLDFDGTMVDSINHYYDVIGQLCPLYRIKPVTREEFDFALQGNYWEVLHRTIPRWKLPIVLMHLKYLVGRKLPSSFSHFQDFVLNAKKKDINLGIVTSNSRRNVVEFLQRENIPLKHFEFVIATHKKNKVMKKIREKYKFDQYYSIGDEKRDIDAALSAGFIPVGVSWGFHKKEYLTKHGAKYILNQFPDFFRILSEK